MTVCLLLTLTRQAWFGFLIGTLFQLSIWKKRFLLIIPILFIAWAFISSENIRSKVQQFTPPKDSSFSEQLKFRVLRILDGKDETLLIRIALWQGGWQIFKDHPLTGCGFRCVDLVNPQYPDPTGYIKALRGMHNNFVQLAVDTGILGLMTWLSIWVCFFLSLFKRAVPDKENSPDGWITLGSAAAVIAFLSGGFFETNFYDSEVASLLFFIMSLPFTVPKENTSESA